jgi:hypothetical protein
MTTAQAWDCAQARPSLGVYVLGAIDPAERGLATAHLLTCQECQGQVADLAGLPEFLSRLGTDEAGRACAADGVDTGDPSAADTGHRSCLRPGSWYQRHLS